MMWSRIDLKMRGKQAFQKNYWSSVVVGLVMMIVSAAFSASRSSSARNQLESGNYFSPYSLFWLTIAAFAAILGVGIVLLVIFVGNVLLVGGNRFFILNQTEMPGVGTLGYGFQSGHYGNIVLTMFLRDLFTALWSLLFVVPGIIKHYEYLMVPFILAENPGMNRKEAFLISKQMMMGKKWEVFVMDISFLGWRILEGMTFGLVGIFYAEPYIRATFAELYAVNREMAFQRGFIR